MTTLLDWKVSDQVVGISFDTTSANTGRLNGACVLIEQKLGKDLLWLACRHHVLEVVCGDVFKKLFGPTSGPNVSLFRRFQEFWPKLDLAAYVPCSDQRLLGDLSSLKNEAIDFAINILQGNAGHLPREDYREMLELVVIFMGQIPPRGVCFRVPGAFHHARWMSKLLYVLKICMFQDQFKLTKHESTACLVFGMFVSLLYMKPWISCTHACDAPVNDLNFIQALHSYKMTSDTVSNVALAAIGRHLWYLSEELAPLGLFSKLVPADIKHLMVAKLLDNHPKEQSDPSTRYTGKDYISNNSLDHFIGPASHLFFSVLKIDTAFLSEDVEKWEQSESFLAAKTTVASLKVVNDSAERGIALATTFNSSVTKQEEQKQFLFQIVESHRRQFPDPKKMTLNAKCTDGGHSSQALSD